MSDLEKLMIHDPDLDASAGTLYWLAHDDHLGETVGRRATPDEVRKWANLTSPETIEKAAEALEAEIKRHPMEPNPQPWGGNLGWLLGASMKELAEAVLRSVEEGET